MNKKKVFILEIIDDQKYSWQGRLRWIDGQKERSFRSVMEMLHLISSTIDGQDGWPEVRMTEEEQGRDEIGFVGNGNKDGKNNGT